MGGCTNHPAIRHIARLHGLGLGVLVKLVGDQHVGGEHDLVACRLHQLLGQVHLPGGRTGSDSWAAPGWSTMWEHGIGAFHREQRQGKHAAPMNPIGTNERGWRPTKVQGPGSEAQPHRFLPPVENMDLH